MDLGQAKALVGLLCAAFPNQSISQATLDVYASGIIELDYDAARAGIAALIREGGKWPTVAEIRSRGGIVATTRALTPDEIEQVADAELVRMHSAGEYVHPSHLEALGLK